MFARRPLSLPAPSPSSSVVAPSPFVLVLVVGEIRENTRLYTHLITRTFFRDRRSGIFWNPVRDGIFIARGPKRNPSPSGATSNRPSARLVLVPLLRQISETSRLYTHLI